MKQNISSNEVSRDELITKLKGLIDRARRISLDELCKVGDYKNKPELKYPQTEGEQIVDEISTLLLPQPWIDSESEPLLDKICSIASQLDTGVDNPEDWKELFDLSSELVT